MAGNPGNLGMALNSKPDLNLDFLDQATDKFFLLRQVHLEKVYLKLEKCQARLLVYLFPHRQFQMVQHNPTSRVPGASSSVGVPAATELV